MKARIEMFQDALDAFAKNEYWKTIYENAPDGAKESLEASFYTSMHDDIAADEFISLCEKIEFIDMTKEDWEYLLATSPGNSPTSSFYQRQIEACDK